MSVEIFCVEIFKVRVEWYKILKYKNKYFRFYKKVSFVLGILKYKYVLFIVYRL